MATQVTRFTVKGLGAFPLDMLRYDAAFPATEIDAGKMHLTFRNFREPIEVTLMTNSIGVTTARWESFGWKVISQETRTY